MQINFYRTPTKRTSTTFSEIETQLISLWATNQNFDLVFLEKIISENLTLACTQGAIIPKNVFLKKCIDELKNKCEAYSEA